MGVTPGCASDTFIFDHCYQKIADEGDFARMEQLGFTFFPTTAEHPHSLLSRIILIGAPEVQSFARTPYLELCLIRDLEGELAHARATKRGTSERDLYKPGFSVRATIPLEECLKASADQWAEMQPTLTHRNYDWKEGEAERRPGWNFLNFDNPPLPDVHLWLTEYEQRPDIPRDAAAIERKRVSCAHANGVNAFAGFVFNLSEDQKRAVSQLVGAEWQNGSLPVGEGLVIHSQQEHAEFRTLLADKASPFTAVILGCRSIRRFSEVSGLQPVSDGSMVRVRSAQPESWDILVVEGSGPDDRGASESEPSS